MSREKGEIFQAAIDGLVGLANSKIKADLAKYEVDARIQAQQDAADLQYERRLHSNELANQLQISTYDYKQSLDNLEDAFERNEKLGLIDGEYIKEIADTKDGTIDGQSILDGLKAFTLNDLQTTIANTEHQGSTLEQIKDAYSRNAMVIDVLDQIHEDANIGIELAERVKEVAISDYNYLNDDLSDSALIGIFNAAFKEYIVHEDGSVLKDLDGNIRPVWNARFQAFKNSIPDIHERTKLQSSLNAGLNMLHSKEKAEKNAEITAYNDAIKAGDKNYKEMWKGIGDYFAYFISDLPDVTPSNIKNLEGQGYYYNVGLHDFSGEKEYSMSGEFGKYGSFDFILGLEEKVEAAILSLAEGATGYGDVTSNYAEELIANGDVQGLIDFWVIPREDEVWSKWSTDEGFYKDTGHHPRLATTEYNMATVADSTTPLGRRVGTGLISNLFELGDAYTDLDLIHGDGDASVVRSAEEGFIKYADLYTLIQNVKQWKFAFDEMKDLFKDNPEGWQMFQRDVGNQWAINLGAVNYESFTEMTDNLNNIFEENRVRYGFPAAGDITSMNVLDYTQGVDTRRTIDSILINDLFPIQPTSGGFKAIWGEDKPLYYLNDQGEYEFNEDVLEDMPEGMRESLLNRDKWDSFFNSRKLNLIEKELSSRVGPDQTTYSIMLFRGLPEDTQESVLKELGQKKSSVEMANSFVAELDKILSNMANTDKDKYNTLVRTVGEASGISFDSGYENSREKFLSDVLSK